MDEYTFPLHAVIGFRLDVDLRLAVQLRLNETGMTLSNYMRWLIQRDCPCLLNNNFSTNSVFNGENSEDFMPNAA